MEFFSVGPLAASIYLVICWSELVIILWMIYVNNSNKKVLQELELLKNSLNQSCIFSIQKTDYENIFNEVKQFLLQNKNISEICKNDIISKLDLLNEKLVKHDKRFFIQTNDIKSAVSNVFENRRKDDRDKIFSKRKIDFYDSEISEDIDADEKGYKEL